MPRRAPEAAGTTWEALAECWGAWEDESGAAVVVELHRARRDGRNYVEIVLYERVVPGGYGQELYRERHPVNLRKAAGVAGQVLHAVFCTFSGYDANPWYWSREKRARMRGEG